MKKTTFYILFIGVFVFLNIPFLGNALSLIDTMFHEFGHAIVGFLLNAEIDKIELFTNTEGVTYISADNNITYLLAGLSGYFATSFVAVIFAILWRARFNRTIVFISLTVSLISLVFFVRNFFGIFWLLLLIIALIIVLATGMAKTGKVSLILTTVMILSSFASSIDIVLITLLAPTEAGDASLLYEVTTIPSFFWGLLFFVQSLIATIFSFFVIFYKNNFLKK